MHHAQGQSKSATAKNRSHAAVKWLVRVLAIECSSRLMHHAEAATMRAQLGSLRPAQAQVTTSSETGAAALQAPRVLLWVPVHVSEPTTNLEAMVTCTFQRHAPSLVGEAFDVLITLAGRASDGREAELGRVVADGVAAITPSAPPTVRTEFVQVEMDAYDRDQSKGVIFFFFFRHSSYAGPNAVFYSVMLDGEGGGQEEGHRGGTGDQTGTGNSSSSPSSIYRRHVAPYAFVQIMETDCCATQQGWLDTLLAPMLADPKLLMSGSRPKAACFSPASQGGTACKVSHPDGARLHINGNAMYRAGPGLQALLRDASALTSKAEKPFDLAMYLVREADQSHVCDSPRMYSIGDAIDGKLWEESAYYGTDNNVALVHAPRRLRQDAVHAVVSRAKKEQLTTAIVVAPTLRRGRRKFGDLAVDVSLLRACHASLVAAHADRSLVYIALTWPAFVEASRLAPFRVLLANVSRSNRNSRPEQPAGLTVHALNAMATLARSGLGMLVMGMGAVNLQPESDMLVPTMHRAGAAGTKPVLIRSGVYQPQTPAEARIFLFKIQKDRVLDASIWSVPPGASSAEFFENWAAIVGAASTGAYRISPCELRIMHVLSFHASTLFVVTAVALCRRRLSLKIKMAESLPRALWKNDCRPHGTKLYRRGV